MMRTPLLIYRIRSSYKGFHSITGKVFHTSGSYYQGKLNVQTLAKFTNSILVTLLKIVHVNIVRKRNV